MVFFQHWFSNSDSLTPTHVLLWHSLLRVSIRFHRFKGSVLQDGPHFRPQSKHRPLFTCTPIWLGYEFQGTHSQPLPPLSKLNSLLQWLTELRKMHTYHYSVVQKGKVNSHVKRYRGWSQKHPECRRLCPCGVGACLLLAHGDVHQLRGSPAPIAWVILRRLCYAGMID